MNKKSKQLAIRSALSAKAEQTVEVVCGIPLYRPAPSGGTGNSLK